MTLEDFQPYILPHAKGCPGAIADLNTRLAIIELCFKAKVWRTDQAEVLTVLDQTAYNFGLAVGQQACELLSMTLDLQDVEIVDPRIGRYRDQAGYSLTYAYGTFSGFELRPGGAAGRSIMTHCVVAPTLTAATVPDQFSRFAEDIAAGALSRILATKDKEYYDPPGAARAAGQWEDAINEAKNAAFGGFSRVPQRTAKVWF